MVKHNITDLPWTSNLLPIVFVLQQQQWKKCRQHPTPGCNIIMLGKWRSQWQCDPPHPLVWESTPLALMFEQGSAPFMSAGWGMWTPRHLLPARLHFNDKNKFLLELWPTQSTVRITFSAGVYLCSERDHPSPVSHCLSSQRLLQALLCSWCPEDLEQNGRK